MICPYCEKEMQAGGLIGDGRSRVRFQPEGVKLTLGDALCGIGNVEAAQYKCFNFNIPAHFCSKCKKLIIDTDISK